MARRRVNKRMGLTSCAGLALIVALTLTGCVGRYTVPTGEIGERTSPYSLQGRITALNADELTVASDDGATTVVQIPPETSFLKMNAGVVLRPELLVGHRVRVWYDSKPGSKAADAKRAAVVMLASLDPRDDWPKE